MLRKTLNFLFVFFVNLSLYAQTINAKIEPIIDLDVTRYIYSGGYSTRPVREGFFIGRNSIKTSDFKNFYFRKNSDIFHLNIENPKQSDFYTFKNINLSFNSAISDVVMNSKKDTNIGVQYKATFYRFINQMGEARATILANVFMQTDTSGYVVDKYEYFDFVNEKNETEIVFAILFQNAATKKQVLKAWNLNDLPEFLTWTQFGEKLAREYLSKDSMLNGKNIKYPSVNRNKSVNYFTENALFTFEQSFKNPNNKIKYIDLWKGNQVNYFGLKILRAYESENYETWYINNKNEQIKISNYDVTDYMSNNGTISVFSSTEKPEITVYELNTYTNPNSKYLLKITLPKMLKPKMVLSPNGKYALVTETETKTTSYLVDLQKGTILANIKVPSLKERKLKLYNENTSYNFKEARFSDDGSKLYISWVYDFRSDDFCSYVYLSLYNIE